MPIRRYGTHTARVRIHPSGKSTLAGLDYRDLRSVLTLASNYCYDRLNQEKIKQDIEAVRYYEQQLRILQMAEKGMDDAISATHVINRSPQPPTIAQRRAAVMESQRTRKLLQDILARVRAQRDNE